MGAYYTRQATWQMIVAGYYSFVDLVLVGQWFWYERLRHGKRTRLLEWKRDRPSFNDYQRPDSRQMVPNLEPLSRKASPRLRASKKRQDSQHNYSPEDLNFLSSEMVWQTPDYGSINRSSSEKLNDLAPGSSSSSRSRSTRTSQPSDPVLSFATPRTILFISLLLSILPVHASLAPHGYIASPFMPLTTTLLLPSPSPSCRSPFTSVFTTSASSTEVAGKILSWLSTFLYLGSRLPQIYKNFRRRSTAGLSPALFVAAFLRNLFYSTSLLTNPLVWGDCGSYGGGK